MFGDYFFTCIVGFHGIGLAVVWLYHYQQRVKQHIKDTDHMYHLIKQIHTHTTTNNNKR
jgi:hypothetical protein